MLDDIETYERTGDGQWMDDATKRYPAFMKLPPGDHVPPMDVDIVWHTHQLSGTKYWYLRYVILLRQLVLRLLIPFTLGMNA
jgi:hypothetical protein